MLANVKTQGDAAVRAYSEKWDGVMLNDFRVSQQEIDEAVANFDKTLLADLIEAADNIRLYHKEQRRTGYKLPLENDSYLAQRIIPLEAVGLYVPGAQQHILHRY